MCHSSQIEYMFHKFNNQLAISNVDELYFLYKAGILPPELMVHKSYEGRQFIMGFITRNIPFLIEIIKKVGWRLISIYSTDDFLISLCKEALLKPESCNKIEPYLREKLKERCSTPSKHICDTCLMNECCKKRGIS